MRGANPADLPVEKPRKFDFGVNLSTAGALGLSVPEAITAQGPELIL